MSKVKAVVRKPKDSQVKCRIESDAMNDLNALMTQYDLPLSYFLRRGIELVIKSYKGKRP